MNSKEETILIVGAGPAGLVLAILLTQKGYKVKVVEQAKEFLTIGYAVSVWRNFFYVMDKVGISHELFTTAHQIPNFTLTDIRGRHSFDVISEDEYRPSTIHRSEIQDLLKKQAELEGVSIMFDKRCVDIKNHRDRVVLSYADGTQDEASYVIGADGMHSTVRKKIFHKESTPLGYSLFFFWTKQEEKQTGMFEMSGNGVVVSKYPTSDVNSFIGIATKEKFEKPTTREEVLPLMKKLFDGAGREKIMKYINALTKDDSILITYAEKLKPFRFEKGRTCLIGDAAHGQSPLLGWGTTLAIEDAYLLASQIANHGMNSATFKRFYEKRKPHLHLIYRYVALADRLNIVRKGVSYYLSRIFLGGLFYEDRLFQKLSHYAIQVVNQKLED